ncbi:MAG: hypothetical protein ACPG7F_01600 [Aggregatilineales bacterium]
MIYNIQHSQDLPILEVTINTPILDGNTLAAYVSDMTATLNTCTQQVIVRIDARKQKFDDIQAVLKSIRCPNNISILEHHMTAAVMIIVNNPELKNAINGADIASPCNTRMKAFLDPAIARAYIHDMMQVV